MKMFWNLLVVSASILVVDVFGNFTFAQPLTITFDDLTQGHGTLIAQNQYVSRGVIFSNQFGGRALLWCNAAAGSVLDDDNGGAFSLPCAIAGNSSAQISVVAKFVDPVSGLQGTTDFVRVGVSSGPGRDLLTPGVRLLAFDKSGNQIASDPADSTLQWDYLSVSTPGIAKVVMEAGIKKDIYDDFTYNPVTPLPNQSPDCSAATPSLTTLLVPDHKFVDITITGVTDPDGDAVTITIDSILQDEPVDTFGDGSFTPDGQGVGTDTAELRAERSGTQGNGRVYHVTFTADDRNGGTCSATVTVCVSHDQSDPTCVDDGALYDSTVP